VITWWEKGKKYEDTTPLATTREGRRGGERREGEEGR
jgi:hypothetical protein